MPPRTPLMLQKLDALGPHARARELGPETLERVRLRDAWGMSPSLIAKAEGLSLRVVNQLLNEPRGDWIALREKIREQIVQRCYQQASMLIEAVSESKAVRESNVQNATAAAILIDKARLLEGLPTTIVGEIEVDIAKLMQPEVLKQLIAAKGGIDKLRPEHRALAEKLGVEMPRKQEEPHGVGPRPDEQC